MPLTALLFFTHSGLRKKNQENGVRLFMLRTTILSIAACLALATNAFAADIAVNLEQSFMVAGHHDDKSSDSKSKDDSSSDDSSSEDDKSHDS